MENIINEFVIRLLRKEIINEITINQIDSGISVKIRSSVLFRVNVKIKTVYRIEIPYNVFSEDENLKDFDMKKDDQKMWIDIYKDEDELIRILDKLSKVIKNRAEQLFAGKIDFAFGCCSKYEECSNIGHCIMSEEDKFYKGCQYKKNLENEKVFYGGNRNSKEEK